MVTRYGQADVPREVSGRGGPAVRPAAADFPRDVCLTYRVTTQYSYYISVCSIFVLYMKYNETQSHIYGTLSLRQNVAKAYGDIKMSAI